MLRGLAKEPAERYATAEEFSAALKGAMAEADAPVAAVVADAPEVVAAPIVVEAAAEVAAPVVEVVPEVVAEPVVEAISEVAEPVVEAVHEVAAEQGSGRRSRGADR